MGPTYKGSLKVSAVIDSVPTIIETVNSLLRKAGCPDPVRRQIDTSLDEIASNIIDYAYSDTSSDKIIEIETSITGTKATLRVCDSGVPFNPLEKEDPDLSAVSEHGGLGIFITKSLMDNLSYNFSDGRNILTLEKSW